MRSALRHLELALLWIVAGAIAFLVTVLLVAMLWILAIAFGFIAWGKITSEAVEIASTELHRAPWSARKPRRP